MILPKGCALYLFICAHPAGTERPKALQVNNSRCHQSEPLIQGHVFMLLKIMFWPFCPNAAAEIVTHQVSSYPVLKKIARRMLRCNNIFLWCTSVLGISKLKRVISAPCLQYYLGHSRIKNKIVKTKLIAQVLLSASDACLHFSNAVFMSLRKICCL